MVTYKRHDLAFYRTTFNTLRAEDAQVQRSVPQQQPLRDVRPHRQASRQRPSLRCRSTANTFNAIFLPLLVVTPVVAMSPRAISSDIGFLQARNGTACYRPHANIAAYPGVNECTNQLLSVAMRNHIDSQMNPKALSVAYYNRELQHVGDANWILPPSGGPFIACYQGALYEKDMFGRAQFHTWCEFVTSNNHFNFADARDSGGVCSRVHTGGMRAERSGCAVPSKTTVWWTITLAFFVIFVIHRLFCAFGVI